MRSIKKAVEDYKQKFRGNDRFTLSDMAQVKEISTDDIYDMIINALRAGYMIGYRSGIKMSGNRKENLR